MLEPAEDVALVAEMLLVVSIVMDEAGRGDEFEALSERIFDRVRADPVEREALTQELRLFRSGTEPNAAILALRSLPPDDRRRVAEMIADFAAGDALLQARQARLNARVVDILDLDPTS